MGWFPLLQNAGEDIEAVLGKIIIEGSEVVAPKTGIGEYGVFAYFLDTGKSGWPCTACNKKLIRALISQMV